MSGKRTGTIEPVKDASGRTYYRGKVRLEDGSRARVEVPESKCYSETASRDYIAWAQEEEDRTHALYRAKLARANAAGGATAGETIRQWFARYYAWCENVDGQTNVRMRRSNFANHIDRDGFGDLPIAGETKILREAIRQRVRYLDEQIAIRDAFYRGEVKRDGGGKPGLAADTAANVWGELTSGFAEACTSKLDAFRVRATEENPTTGIQGPDKRPEREQAALYPSEVIALLACEDVPLYRREVYAVCIYAGLRQGECRGLVASDIDFEHGVINVRRQRKKVAANARTKTRAGIRPIPIHPHLEPLLRALIERADVEHAKRLAMNDAAAPGPLVHVPPVEDCAERVREDLRKAGCDREELFRDDDERQHFTFHGLRHTCLTHWAVSGMPLAQLMAAAGHTDYETTERYIDGGAILRGQRFGEPHAPLPESFVRATLRTTLAGAPPKRVVRTKQKGQILGGSSPSSHVAIATPAGIEPALPA